MSASSLSSALLASAERKGRSGKRALESLMKKHSNSCGSLDLAALSRVVEVLLPQTDPRDVLALFEAHTTPDARSVPARALTHAILTAEGDGGRMQRAPSPSRPPHTQRPPPPRHAWDEWSAPAPVGPPAPRVGDAASLARRGAGAPTHQLPQQRRQSGRAMGRAEAPAPAKVSPHLLSEAIRQVQQVLDVRAADAVLPPSERITLHRSSRAAAKRQIALLRAIRAVTPGVTHVSEAELASALSGLVPDFLAQRGHAGVRVLFAEAQVQHGIWNATQGDIELVLDLLCPLPQSADRPPPPPHRFDGQHSGFVPERLPAPARASVPGVTADSAGPSGRPAFGPPFDRESGRKGKRHVAPPPRESIPLTIRYRFSQSGVHVPPHFDPRLVTRSALPPPFALRREFVYGYNGLGRHNRSPNVFALPDGRVLYCAAALAIVYDPVSSEQSYYEGHDDDITCVALHPGGRLAVTGQCASAFSGTAPWLTVWDINSKQEVSRVGWVADERENSTQGRAHAPGATPPAALPSNALPAAHATTVPPPAAYRAFYQRSVCAVAFSPDGALLIGVGTDDQHTIAVWNWRRRELLVSSPGLAARPPGVHQIAVAPAAPPGGNLVLVSVGLAAQPKFWTLSPPRRPPTGAKRRLAAAAAATISGLQDQPFWALKAQLGRIGAKEGELPKSLSCVTFGGTAFASPSGAPHGLIFIGGGGGRIFVFDYPNSPAALHVIRDAHSGVAVTALAAADGGIVSGGADGRILFWAPAPAGRDAAGRERLAHMIQKPAHAYVIGYPAVTKAPGAPVLKGERKVHKPGKDATAVSAATALASSLVGGAGAVRSLAIMPKAMSFVGAPAAFPDATNPPNAEGARAVEGRGRVVDEAGTAREERRGVRFADATDNVGGAPRALAASTTTGVDSRLSGVTLPRLLVGTARCSLWICAPPRTGKDAAPNGSSQELTAGHFADALAVEAHPLRPDVWASAGSDRQLLLWKRGPRRTPVQRAELSTGAACLAFAPDGSLIAAGLLDGTIALIKPTSLDYPATEAAIVSRAETATPQRDARSALCDIKFSPGSGAHGGLLATAGHDRVIDVYRIDPEGGGKVGVLLHQVACCRGHTSTVTHLDWSTDGSMLMSNCSAKEILFWAMPAGKRMVSHSPSIAAATWASWTCVLGFPAIGIWPDGSDGSDVNAAHRSSDGSLLLTVDDFGMVKLFNCPCVVEDAPYRSAAGHCSHVSCGRFLTGDKAAVSSGGSDRTIMLWRLEPELDEGRDAFRQESLPINRAAWRSNGYGQASNPLR